jgi:hypothetical protein
MSLRRSFVTCAGAASIACLGLFAVACGASSSGVAVQSADGAGPSSPGSEGGSTTDAEADASADAPAGACQGACKTTALVADFGGKKRTLVRAQFGTQQGDAGAELHTESHLGGSAACPSQSSPSPDYTLIVTSVPRGVGAGTKLSDRDGITSAFFDFKGDLGLAAPSGITKALSVNVTVVGEDPATPPAWVALDVIVAFTEGEVRGHLYADYCDSLTQ